MSNNPYTSDSHIVTPKEVRKFFRYLIQSREIDLHPDNTLEEGMGSPALTADEAALFNRLVKEGFTVCQEKGANIYEYGYEEMQNYVTVKKRK